VTLAEAAGELGLDPSTLRRQIARGKLRARKVGPVWTVSPAALELYRREHLGRRGRYSADVVVDEGDEAP
jgi:excisionase family DNA binding protein